MQKEFKIIILWIVVMCGLTIHSLADLMPLLWSANIAVSISDKPCDLIF